MFLVIFPILLDLKVLLTLSDHKCYVYIRLYWVDKLTVQNFWWSIGSEKFPQISYFGKKFFDFQVFASSPIHGVGNSPSLEDKCMGGLLFEAQKGTKKFVAVRKFPKIFSFIGFF